METIYCGIRKPERTLAIGNAMLAGEPVETVCVRFNVRKKTALSCKETAAAVQQHEISLTDGSMDIPLARFVVAGGGGYLPRHPSQCAVSKHSFPHLSFPAGNSPMEMNPSRCIN